MRASILILSFLLGLKANCSTKDLKSCLKWESTVSLKTERLEIDAMDPNNQEELNRIAEIFANDKVQKMNRGRENDETLATGMQMFKRIGGTTAWSSSDMDKLLNKGHPAEFAKVLTIRKKETGEIIGCYTIGRNGQPRFPSWGRAGEQLIFKSGIGKEGEKWVLVGAIYHPDYWNKGYHSEVGHAVYQYIFNTLGVDGIYANIHKDNIGSLRTSEKHGFTEFKIPDFKPDKNSKELKHFYMRSSN